MKKALKPQRSKKAYSRPKLTTHGDVAKLTKVIKPLATVPISGFPPL